jgi:hypothetical protein
MRRSGSVIDHGIYGVSKTGGVQLKTDSEKREPISVLVGVPFDRRGAYVKLRDQQGLIEVNVDCAFMKFGQINEFRKIPPKMLHLYVNRSMCGIHSAEDCSFEYRHLNRVF